MEGGVWWASQAQGLVHDGPTCQQVVDTILAEAERIIEEVLPASCRPAATPAGS
jgi:nitronate monooxygenase